MQCKAAYNPDTDNCPTCDAACWVEFWVEGQGYCYDCVDLHLEVEHCESCAHKELSDGYGGNHCPSCGSEMVLITPSKPTAKQRGSTVRK